MLAFLLHAAASPKFLKDAQQQKQQNTEQNKAVFFDILVFQRTFIFLSGAFIALIMYHEYLFLPKSTTLVAFRIQSSA